MLFEGMIGGAPLNELALNATPADPIFASEAVATIRVAPLGNPAILGNVFASSAIAGLAFSASGEATINSTSESVSRLAFDALMEPTVSPGSQGLAETRLAPLGSATVSPSSGGLAVARLLGQGQGTISPSSAGMATLRLSAGGNITVSGGVDSGGIAQLRVRPRLMPYVWTYLYNAGLAEIYLDALANPRHRPLIPTTFYPALERLEAAGEDWRGSVADDGANMEVRPDRSRLTVPEEEMP